MLSLILVELNLRSSFAYFPSSIAFQ